MRYIAYYIPLFINYDARQCKLKAECYLALSFHDSGLYKAGELRENQHLLIGGHPLQSYLKSRESNTTHWLSRLFSARSSSYPLVIQVVIGEVFLVPTGYPGCSRRGVPCTHWLSRLFSTRCSSYPLVLQVALDEVSMYPLVIQAVSTRSSFYRLVDQPVTRRTVPIGGDLPLVKRETILSTYTQNI